MGMFDSVTMRCPQCDEIVEHQSKAGRCQLNTYSLDDCPLDIMADIAKDTIYCKNGHQFHIQLQVIRAAKAIAGKNPIDWY